MKPSAFERIARLRRDPFALLIVLFAGLGTAHILVRTAPYGTAVGTDSVYFLSTAINFLAGEGWRDFQGSPLVGWPPLFPLLLATGGWVGIEPFAAGRWINATAFGLTILVVGCWLRSNVRTRWLGLAATVSITTSLSLSEFASRLMTDSLFALFALLALVQLASFFHRGGRTPLLLGAVCTALAALTRYPGVVLIGTGVLLLLVRRAPSLAARLKDAIVFGAISFFPLALVLTYNYAVSGNPDRAERRVRQDVRWADPSSGCIPGVGSSPRRTRRVGLSPMGSARAGPTGLVRCSSVGDDWAGCCGDGRGGRCGWARHGRE